MPDWWRQGAACNARTEMKKTLSRDVERSSLRMVEHQQANRPEGTTGGTTLAEAADYAAFTTP